MPPTSQVCQVFKSKLRGFDFELGRTPRESAEAPLQR